MKLQEIEDEIAHVYRWFAAEAPGVRVQEHGRLAQLWREFEFRIDAEEGNRRDEPQAF